MAKQIDIDGYLADKGRLVRSQLDKLSNEQLALWADKIYSETFETPAGRIGREAEEFKAEVTPF